MAFLIAMPPYGCSNLNMRFAVNNIFNKVCVALQE